MSYAKRNFNLFRSASLNIVLGLLLLAFPFILIHNFSLLLCFLFMLSTFSAFNVLNPNKKSCLAILLTPLSNLDDGKDRFLHRKSEKKEFSFWKVLTLLISSIGIFYTASVMFGAPLVESATLYFSLLMTTLTIYPMTWYFYANDSLTAILKIAFDSKFDSLIESHFHSIMTSTVIGAWFGAVPIPLDWDRPWQVWPISCCMGATIGNGGMHLYIGIKMVFSNFRDKRKTSLKAV